MDWHGILWWTKGKRLVVVDLKNSNPVSIQLPQFSSWYLPHSPSKYTTSIIAGMRCPNIILRRLSLVCGTRQSAWPPTSSNGFLTKTNKQTNKQTWWKASWLLYFLLIGDRIYSSDTSPSHLKSFFSLVASWKPLFWCDRVRWFCMSMVEKEDCQQ